MKPHTLSDDPAQGESVRRSLARPLFFVTGLLLVAAVIFAWAVPARSSTIPTLSITSVVTDDTVSVQAHNFPANQNFVVTMGPMGSRGINGVVVGTTNSGVGGTFNATYDIPASLAGSEQIAVRLQTSHAHPYFAYNWFWNNTAGSGSGSGGTGGIPGYSGVPSFAVTSVVAGESATIQTNNFPPNQTFTITMGPFGTQGIGGHNVGTINSGVGGTLTATFDIPDQLKSAQRVAVRAQTSHAAPFFAYNWFYNNTTGSGGTGGIPPTTPPTGPVYSGTPTFTVCSVVQNTSVTVRTKEFPPNQTFTVTMGPFGTQGIGGHNVGTINSGVGGELTATFTIPSQLAGSGRIAVRMQSAGSPPFFAYNWFFNNTATVC